jgi:Tol biopolymer transport system component
MGHRSPHDARVTPARVGTRRPILLTVPGLGAVISLIASLLLAAGGVVFLTTPAAATLPGGNGLIAYVDFDGTTTQIYTENPEVAGSAENVSDSTYMDSDPAWSPDGTRIAFTRLSGPQHSIWTMAADGSDQQPVTDGTVSSSEPAWGPGGIIVYVRNDSGSVDLWLHYSDDTEQQLTGSSWTESQPSWSQDGLKIAFQADVNGAAQVFVRDRNNGGSVTNISDGAPWGYEPDWYPSNNSKIVFASLGNTNGGIWTMNFDGSAESKIPNTAHLDSGPKWSPDATTIVFNRATQAGSELWMTDTSGNASRFSPVNEYRYNADWQPTPGGDLALTGSVSPQEVRAGRPVTYSFRIANSGPSTSKDPYFQFFPETYESFIDYTAPNGTECIAGGGSVTCVTPRLQAGATADITITTSFGPRTRKGVYVKSVSVNSGITRDPDFANNTISLSVTVSAKAR